jgi:Cu+-exporting ATPase
MFLPRIRSSIAAQNPASPNGATTAATKQKTIQVRIAGMTCAACARGLEASFRKMAGVEKAAVDYKSGEAVITFDPGRQSAESLSKFVTGCGYQVKETKVI